MFVTRRVVKNSFNHPNPIIPGCAVKCNGTTFGIIPRVYNCLR